MTRLLSDEELNDKLFDLISLASMQGFEQASGDNSSGKKLDTAIKEYQELINTQKIEVRQEVRYEIMRGEHGHDEVSIVRSLEEREKEYRNE